MESVMIQYTMRPQNDDIAPNVQMVENDTPNVPWRDN